MENSFKKAYKASSVAKTLPADCVNKARIGAALGMHRGAGARRVGWVRHIPAGQLPTCRDLREEGA